MKGFKNFNFEALGLKKLPKHLTMTQLNNLGYHIVKSFVEKQNLTQRRKKGLIIIETTWEMPSGRFISQDVKVEGNYIDGFTAEELIKLRQNYEQQTQI